MPKRIPLVSTRELNKRAEDHILHKLLKDRGFTNTGVSRLLGVRDITFKRMMKDPCQAFTLSQLIILAGLLNIPVLQVVCLVMGKREGPAREEGSKWYEMDKDSMK